MNSRRRRHEEDDIVRSPFEWLFHAAVLLFGTAIALTLALELLAAIWHWLVGGALLATGIYVAARIAMARRRQW